MTRSHSMLLHRRTALAAALAALAILGLSLTMSISRTSAAENKNDASLNIRKDDQDGHPLAGAVFTVEGQSGTFTTGADGKFCITGLPDDTFWTVTEIQAPAGYALANPASQLVEVDDDGDCNSPDARFVNVLAAATPTPTPESSVAGNTSTPTPSSESSVEGGTSTSSPEGAVEGATGTPGGALADTAMGTGTQPSAVPTVAFGLILLVALLTLAWANLKSRRQQL